MDGISAKTVQANPHERFRIIAVRTILPAKNPRADFTAPRDIQACVSWTYNPGVTMHSTSPASSTDSTGTQRSQQNSR